MPAAWSPHLMATTRQQQSLLATSTIRPGNNSPQLNPPPPPKLRTLQWRQSGQQAQIARAACSTQAHLPLPLTLAGERSQANLLLPLGQHVGKDEREGNVRADADHVRREACVEDERTLLRKRLHNNRTRSRSRNLCIVVVLCGSRLALCVASRCTCKVASSVQSLARRL